MNNSPKISVIVPVYKVEKYLSQCLDSILAQTFTDFEVLLIEDGSPDKSGEICDEYVQKDSRVRAFHKENGGVSSARNLGLDKAKGEWVTFIDADDWINPNFIKNLYSPIQENCDIDFVQAGCTNYIDGQIVNIEQQYEYYKDNDPIYVFNNFRGLTFSKLFNLENVIRTHSLHFDEKMRTTEDMAFTLDYLIHIKTYCFIPEVGYYYRHTPSSLTRSESITPYANAHAEFKHLYASVQRYIDLHCIIGEDKYFRKQQNAERLFGTLINIYRHNFTREKRLWHLKNDFSEDEKSVLQYLNASILKQALIYLYMKKYYRLFDMIMHVVLFITVAKRKVGHLL